GTGQTVVSAAGTIQYSYTAQFPMTIHCDNVTEMGLHGTWEDVREYLDVFDLATATALGNAEVAISSIVPKRVIGVTRTPGFHPGQSLSLVIPNRNLNSTYL